MCVYSCNLPEDIVPENFLFQWPDRTKMHRIYQNLLKEVNCDHKYVRCTYLIDNNFEFLKASITLDQVALVCAEIVKYKPTGNIAGFIAY